METSAIIEGHPTKMPTGSTLVESPVHRVAGFERGCSDEPGNRAGGHPDVDSLTGLGVPLGAQGKKSTHCPDRTLPMARDQQQSHQSAKCLEQKRLVTLNQPARTGPLRSSAGAAPVLSLFGAPSIVPNLRLPLNEAGLIEALRQGEASAFVQLYDRYRVALYDIVLRIVKEKPLAEDVLQEAFLRIWHRFGDYDASKGRVFTWLLNVTRNLAIDKLRSRECRQGKRCVSHGSTDSLGLARVHSYQPELTGVRDLLVHLREEERTVVEMIYFRDYTGSQVAQALDLPLGTVKTRLRTALSRLRRSLTALERVEGNRTSTSAVSCPDIG